MAGRSKNTFGFSINKIKALPIPTDRDKVVYHDDDTRELSLSVFKSGEMTFGVYYTILRDGKRKTAYWNMGKWSNRSIEDARKLARKVKDLGKQGWDYKDYLREHDEIRTAQRSKEKIKVAFEASGGLAGQLARGWDDLIVRKHDLGKEGLQNLRGTYRKHVFEHWPENTWIADITESECIRWKVKFAERQTMWNHLRVYLNMIFDEEVYQGRLTRNPLERVAAYSLKEGFCVLTEAGVDKFFELFENPERYPAHQRNYCRYLMLLLLTGQRPINLRSLKRYDDGVGNFVDYDNMAFIFRVHKTTKKAKNKAERVIFSEEVLDILEQARDENTSSEWAIPSCDTRDRYKNTQLSEERSREFFNQYRDQLETHGDSELTLYKLRHTYATQLMAEGVPKERIAKVLLHSPNSRSTSRYARILDDTMKETVEVAANMFRRKGKSKPE